MQRNLVYFLLALGSVGLTALAADESLVGTYNGHLITLDGYQVGVRIIITSFDGKNIKGSTVHYGNVCNDEAPIEGTVVGQKVSLASQKIPGCNVRKYDLQRDGNKLSGTLTNFRGQVVKYEVRK